MLAISFLRVFWLTIGTYIYVHALLFCMTKHTKTARVTIRLAPDVLSDLQNAADAEHRTLANYLRSIITAQVGADQL